MAGVPSPGGMEGGALSLANLDDVSSFARVDPDDFLGVVERFPHQLLEAWQIGLDAGGLPDVAGIDSIAVLGMGGSGISGDVASAVLGPVTRLIIGSVKGYAVPGWVGPGTLLFAVSYSGDTEETLAAFDAALERGARVVIVASGGELAERGRSGGVPVIGVPGGLQPRAAIGYLAMPILAVCARLGLVPPLADEIAEAAALAEARARECGRASPVGRNPAKALALRLARSLPVVYGSEGVAAVAAYRWKCQLNEVAKVPATTGIYPEVNHNEVVGWGGRADIARKCALVVLRHPGEHPRVARRIEVTRSLLGGNFGVVEEVATQASSRLARLLDLAYIGDFTSTYLALATGIDPTPVEIIDRLKRSL
ncbi:MAG: bifunctional phosphoglucose/phosphomannose isomerase [Actinomycetota bacterium]